MFLDPRQATAVAIDLLVVGKGGHGAGVGRGGAAFVQRSDRKQMHELKKRGRSVVRTWLTVYVIVMIIILSL